MDSYDDSNPSLFQSRTSYKTQSNPSKEPAEATAKSTEALQQIFNTVLVRTQPAMSGEEISRELLKAVGSPAFRAILGAVQRLSVEQEIDEKQAAEQIIATFRKVDRLWGDYLCREGTEAVLRPKT